MAGELSRVGRKVGLLVDALIKKKIKFSSYIRKFGMEQLHMREGFLIYEEMRKYFAIYEEAVSHI